jgi:SAM-dependent methyltransferase
MKLEEITQIYPSDKCKTYGHDYIPGYEDLLCNIRLSAKTVLEIGIGCCAHEKAMQRSVPQYNSGNSIRMWRDYFKSATIYAIDIFEEGMIKGEERIETFVANQGSETVLLKVTSNVGGSYDFICDDGSHEHHHQVFSFKVLEKYLNPGGIYVIEDVQPYFINSFKDLSIFGTEYAQYIKENYNISFYDTREGNKSDDFLMCFTKKTIVFVITRAIQVEQHKELWYRCYRSIRQFYKNIKIVIIDDNSHLTDNRDAETLNTLFIKSEFPRAGEILPYYYFLKQKWADKMIVLHDSMFLAREFTDIELNGSVKFLWHFSNHKWDDDQLNLLKMGNFS